MFTVKKCLMAKHYKEVLKEELIFIKSGISVIHSAPTRAELNYVH
jgi:hypothetical protein